MLRIKRVGDILGKQVYTSEGDFFGQVEEVNVTENKVDGWRIRIGSGFMSMLGGARGVIIPHQFVRAIGDVVIVNKASLPVSEPGMTAEAVMSEDASPDVVDLV
ncbi:hypothetical protein CMI48_00650 [Candidatus Pacearchaeota archaeon]|nr:hypothetical protein [Candidatus Pacearchaeota archaeon]